MAHAGSCDGTGAGRGSAPAMNSPPRNVTWVGIDGYYYQHGQHFGSAFGRTIRRVRKLTKAPILLSEAGIGQVAGQARTMPDLFAGIRRYHLLGLVWFDVAQHAGTVHQDWR